MNGLTNIDPEKIYYDSNTKFLIIPKLKKNDEDLFNKYLNAIKIKTNNSYFWTYNQNFNSIVVDENTENVDYDIFNQFTALASWIFSRNYDLKGSFFCKYGHIIEYIVIDGKNKVIVHNVLMDFDYNNINKEIPEAIKTQNNILSDRNTDNNIIIHTKNKIKEYKKNINFEKTNKTTTLEEHSVLITEIQKRLITTENKIKSLGEMNKSLWRLCTIITLVTVGSIIYHIFWETQNSLPG